VKLQKIRAATLQDVADLAGVSRCTASSVLNGARSGTRTSEATRERVRQAAAELAYRPNAVARSLRHQSTQTIGFYNGYGYVDARNPFLSDLIAGFHAQCDATDNDLLIHRVSNRSNVRVKFLELISGKVDGVVLWTPQDDQLSTMVAERQFPAVAIADAHPELPSVTADDAGGSIIIARRLAKQGHKRVLYRLIAEGRWSSDQRYHAFLAEAVRLGMQVTTGIADDYAGTLSEQEKRLITGPADIRPTAVVSWCDNYAMVTYEFLMEQGIRIGEGGVAVVGFDGFVFQGMPVKLTSVQIPWDEVAVMAVDVLRRVIAGESVNKLTTIPVTLIEGDTG